MLSISEIKSLKDPSTVIREYEHFLNHYTFAPDRKLYPFPKIGTVLDEDKSVKWNKEEVERLRAANAEEARRLQLEHSKYIKAFDYALAKTFAAEYHLTITVSEKILKMLRGQLFDVSFDKLPIAFHEIAQIIACLKK